jgi:hypothetical protein
MWTVEFVHVLSLCLTSYNNYLCTDSRFLIEHGTLHQYYIFNQNNNDKNTTKKATEMSNTDPIKNQG